MKKLTTAQRLDKQARSISELQKSVKFLSSIILKLTNNKINLKQKR